MCAAEAIHLLSFTIWSRLLQIQNIDDAMGSHIRKASVIRSIPNDSAEGSRLK